MYGRRDAQFGRLYKNKILRFVFVMHCASTNGNYKNKTGGMPLCQCNYCPSRPTNAHAYFKNRFK
jgi:hypothetical protein